MYPYSLNTEVRWLGKTVKETRPLYRFSNYFCVRLKLKVHEFGGTFGDFFDHAQLLLVGDAPILWQMKGLMEIYKCGNFHGYSFCGCQVI